MATPKVATRRAPRTPKAARDTPRERERKGKGKGKAPAAAPARAERPDWPRDGSRGLVPATDTSRPHVRLGLLWFVAATVSLVGGPIGLAVPYGGAAALGAAQTARAWQRVGRHPLLPVAVVAAVALPAATALASWGLGAAILLGVAASVGLVGGDSRSILTDGAATVRCWLFVGLAAASVVAVARMDLGGGVALVLLTSVYDCGNYLMGSESRWPVVGVLSGVAAVAVMTFSLFVVAIPPFGGADVVPYGVAAALLAPLGQVAGSLVLPDGRALASGLRRLDSVLLVGPAWLALFAVAPPG